MSFLSVLRSIGHGLQVAAGVAAIAEPIVSAIPAAKPVDAILQAIMLVEGFIQAPKSGSSRKAVATALVNAVHPGLNQDQLGTAIDGIVAALNGVQAALEKAPAPPA